MTNSYATMSYMHTNLEQGHKNIITNMLCLGMYLGLLWGITKTITKPIDSITYYESAYLYWICQT